MSDRSATTLLHETLRHTERRYRLPDLGQSGAPSPDDTAAGTLAIVIEQARAAQESGTAAPASAQREFVSALARMIHEALDAESGDPAFQAMVLHHSTDDVRDYALLSTHYNADRRQVQGLVNGFAHPAKLRLMTPGPLRDTLFTLQQFATDENWPLLQQTIRALIQTPPGTLPDPGGEAALATLHDSPSFARLLRHDFLSADPRIRDYQALRDRNGPRSGTPNAHLQGVLGQRRGAAVEAIVAEALAALAERLNQAEGRPCYRIVTSMRVPASFPGEPERAKTEWDSVLLRQADPVDEATHWDVCLMVEAKASADAASSDLPRLLRGLHLLAGADPNTTYPFNSQQGVISLRGRALRALDPDTAHLPDIVLYCSNAPLNGAPRLLGAASRMQLLSEPPCLDFAARIAAGQSPDPDLLAPVWHHLLDDPRLSSILHQYPVLRRARDLMVHPDDLLAALHELPPVQTTPDYPNTCPP